MATFPFGFLSFLFRYVGRRFPFNQSVGPTTDFDFVAFADVASGPLETGKSKCLTALHATDPAYNAYKMSFECQSEPLPGVQLLMAFYTFCCVH